MYRIIHNVKIGHRGPLLRGATGKVLAAGLSQTELDALIKEYLEKGIIQETDLPRILRDLKDINLNGYTVSIEERFTGCASIGVPIRDLTGQIQASLTMTMPLEGLTRKRA